ncbi:MAG TPA: hypothetical protein VN661_01030 [Candidatus Acidoferrales bacterium]|nr:hypothetical protein [Candidatus Acidoferrales bacterium]
MNASFQGIRKIALRAALISCIALFACALAPRANAQAQDQDRPKIQPIDPPEDGFFTKELSFHGVLIKAPSVVDDQAMYVLYDRMARETAHLPMVVTNLAASGAQIHIIGRNQVTTDLPEWRQDKHVPLDEYNGLTRDQRTRGMGGLTTSCAEENLLNLPNDRYRGRDICMHEFAHNIEGHGMQPSVRAMFDKQYEISKSKGLWLNSYAGSNHSEYFAELTMWYFGTHGDLTMTGPKPENGPEGLKKYDPDAYKLMDDFYSGRIEITKVEARQRPAGLRRTPRDSLLARAIVADLTSYKVGETKLADFLEDAGMSTPSDPGTNGWHVTQPNVSSDSSAASGSSAAFPMDGPYRFQVFFRNPATAAAAQPATAPASASSSASGAAANTQTAGAQAANAQRRFRPGGDRLIADVEFNDGVMSSFKWDN